MDKKQISLSSAFLSLTYLTSAQLVDQQQQTSIKEMVTELIGVQVSDPYALAGVAASVGVLWATTYIVLKVGFDKLDILDKLTPSSGRVSSDGGGRNIVAILSLLIVLSMLGTGAFSTVISSWQALVGATFGIGIIVLLLWVALGGAGLGIGGSTYIAGKSTKGAAHGVKEGAEGLKEANEAIQEAGNWMSESEEEEQEAEETGNDAEARDAAEKLERALEDIKVALEDLESIDEKDEAEIRDVIKDAKNKDMGAGLGPEKDFEKKVNDINGSLATLIGAIAGASSSVDLESRIVSNSPYSDFNDWEQEIQQLYEDLEAFANLESRDESSMEKEMRELIDVVKDFEKTKDLLNNLESEIKEAKKADNFEEKLAEELGDKDLYEEAEVEKREVRELGEELEQLEEMRQNLESEIEQGISLVRKQLDLEESELEELEKIREQIIPQMRQNKEEVENRLRSQGWFSPGSNADDEALMEVLDSIDIDKLENMLVRTEERMEGEEGTLRNKLNQVLDIFP